MGRDFVKRGRALVAKSEFQDAADVCRAGLDREPEQIDGWLVLGAALMALGKFREVKIAMEQLLRQQPEHPMGLALLGEACLRTNQREQALEYLERARKQKPDDHIISVLYEEASGGVPAPSEITNGGGSRVLMSPDTVNLDLELVGGGVEHLGEKTDTRIGVEPSKSSIEIGTADVLLEERSAKTGSHGFYDDSSGPSHEQGAAMSGDRGHARGKASDGEWREPTDMRVIRSGVRDLSKEHEALPEARGRFGFGATLGYVLFAAVVFPSAVWAGFQVRANRFQTGMNELKAEAEKYAVEDTFQGHLRAKSLYERALDTKSSKQTRAAFAKSSAALAADFGYERDVARRLIPGLYESPDANAARGLVALSDWQPDRAQTIGEELKTSLPESFLGSYLLGRAALQRGDPGTAVLRFKEGLVLEKRPSLYLGLANAQFGLNEVSKARTALASGLGLYSEGRHPALAIANARYSVLRGDAKEAGRAVKELRTLIENSDGDQLSPEQAAWIRLTLAENHRRFGRLTKSSEELNESVASAPTAGWDLEKARINLLLRLGDRGRAGEVAEKSIKRFGSINDPRVVSAEIALESRRPARALGLLAEMKANESSGRALRAKGAALVALGKSDEAIDVVDRALAKLPGDVSARSVRSEIDLLQGNSDAAIRRLRDVDLARSPAKVTAVYAASLYASGRTEEARQLLTEKLESQPSEMSLVIELAKQERFQGRRSAAEKLYAKAIKSFPEDESLALRWLLTRYENGDKVEPAEGIDRLAENHNEAETLLAAARVNIALGKHKRALDLLARLSNDGRPNWEATFLGGLVSLREGRAKEAKEALEASASLVPANPEVQLALLKANLRLKNVAKQREIERNLAKNARGTHFQALGQAHVALAKGRSGDAAAAFGRAFELSEKLGRTQRAETSAWFAEAIVNEDSRQAKTALARSLSLDPLNARANLLSGHLAFEEKDFAAATAFYQTSLDADPFLSIQTLFFLGIAELQQGNRELAKQSLEKFVELSPKDENASIAKKQLERLK